MTSNSSPRPSGISRWKVALFLAVLFTITAAVLEFGTRLYLKNARGYDGQHLYQFAFDPYKNVLPTPDYVDTRGIRHNSMGFRRSTEVSLTKPTRTYRIFLMGGSTAYGLGGLWPHLDDKYPVLTNSETIDAYLEQALNSAVPGWKVEVINAAITSTWTHHNLIYLNQTILKYDPDMVLFLDGFNDYYHFSAGHDQFASYEYSLPSRVILAEPTTYTLAYANGWWFFRKSALVHMLARGASNLRRLLSRPSERPPIDVEQAVSRHQRVFSANAYKMEERAGLILQNEGVIPVFMVQPMLILERDRRLTNVERRMFEFNVSSYLPNYEAFITRAVQYVRTRMSEMAPRVSGIFIDLTTTFKDVDGQIYTDYAHLTPRGNQLAAQFIADRILPVIRQRTSHPATTP